MAAIERKELEQSYLPDVPTGVQRPQLALVKRGAETGAARNGHSNIPARALPGPRTEAAGVEVEKIEAKGWPAWWRTLQIARVLGTMSLYLFLNDYDIRADFNRRAAGRKLEEARGRGLVEAARGVDQRIFATGLA